MNIPESDDVKVNLNIHLPPATETVMVAMNCSHCKLPHMVEPNYREKYAAKAKEFGAALDDVWMCGGCTKAYYRLPETARCECQHDVPPFPEGV